VLSDIPKLSVFFFLRPNLENHEADSMYKEWGVTRSGRDRYADALARAHTRLEAIEGEMLTEDDVARLIDDVTEETGMKRSGVLKVLRHALTGRKVSHESQDHEPPSLSTDRVQWGLSQSTEGTDNPEYYERIRPRRVTRKIERR